MPTITRSKNPAVRPGDADNSAPRAASEAVAATKKTATLKKKAADDLVAANEARVIDYEAQLDAKQKVANMTAANPEVVTRKKAGRPVKEKKSGKGKKAKGKGKNTKGNQKSSDPSPEEDVSMDIDKAIEELPLVSVSPSYNNKRLTSVQFLPSLSDTGVDSELMNLDPEETRPELGEESLPEFDEAQVLPPVFARKQVKLTTVASTQKRKEYHIDETDDNQR